MARITVDERPDGAFTVSLDDEGVTTTHCVRVPTGFLDELGCGDVPAGELVRCSFVFLLEREPARAILREFSLEQIGGYFPEYGAEIRKALRSP
jgi:hypothetical protein